VHNRDRKEEGRVREIKTREEKECYQRGGVGEVKMRREIHHLVIENV